VKLEKTKTGEYNPNWRTQVRNNSSATTPFDGVIQNCVVEPGYMKVTFWYPLGQPRPNQRVEFTRINGQFATPAALGFSDTGDTTSANNSALVFLARKIQKTNDHFMGGVFLGELNEVIRMITRPARTLREGLGGYISALSKRKGRAPKHRLKQILADTWLEYSFGWKPLINDIKDAAETMARWELEKEGILYRRTSLKSFAYSELLASAPQSTPSVVNNYCYHLINTRNYGSSKVIYRVGLEYKATAPVGSAKRLAELSGLAPSSLLGFVPTAWELLPWSFLVDYFSNVGDILAYSCTDKSNLTWKNKSTVIEGRQEVYYPVNTTAVNSAISSKDLISIEGSSLGSRVATRAVVQRRALANLDYPKLEFNIPGKPVQWINMAALSLGARSITPYRK
jgi:hypothetical protein